jgi:DNA modification methylase
VSDSVQFICGNALTALRSLEDASVHCVVTSPPYWGLRDYGIPPTHWPEVRYELMPGSGCYKTVPEMTCHLGLEPDPFAFVGHLVLIFREVWRVLRPDGTLWLNLGDSAATGAGKVGDCPGGGEQGDRWTGYRGSNGNDPKKSLKAEALRPRGPLTQPNRMPQAGLPKKNRVGQPWRVAFALQAEGWRLRMDNIWSKPNAAPESAADRPTCAHEYFFLFSKKAKYYYDAAAIMEPVTGNAHPRGEGINVKSHNDEYSESVGHGGLVTMRNKRSVFQVNCSQYKGLHFATFPPKLVLPAVLAGCPVGGTCLDPFAGSWTVGEVCVQTGRKMIGIDMNPDHIEQGKRRCDTTPALQNLS